MERAERFGHVPRGILDMYSRSAFAEDLFYGSDKPSIVLRKRAVLTHCANSYLSDELVPLNMCRARICRLGLLMKDVQQSLATWRAGRALAPSRRRVRRQHQPETCLLGGRGDRDPQGWLRDQGSRPGQDALPLQRIPSAVAAASYQLSLIRTHGPIGAVRWT